jgi:dihydrofolate synthase/folylpolyglutamate synthase
MTFDEAVQYLHSLGHETLAMKLGLTNIERLLAALDNPQNSYLKIQIAGTNGKGSTAAMLDSICRAAKIKTGLYTSPHLISITERIKINGVEISEENFARLATIVKETAQKLVAEKCLETLPTFFEQVTAIALLAFRNNVDVAVLETGLGGRLDATTAAQAEIAGITPIAYDHQEYLGNTLAEIAFEKASIIRPNTKAIIAPQDAEAMNVILKRCDECSVTPIIIEERGQSLPSQPEILIELNDENSKIDRDKFNKFTGQEGRLCPRSLNTLISWLNSYNQKSVCLNLRGRHQLTNASVAICLAETLNDFGYNISYSDIVKGLETVTHAGRLEMWNTKPPILFDGAHNVAGAIALKNYLQEFVSQPITLIFGAMREKEIDEIAALLFPLAQEIILTKPDSPRAASLEPLAEKFNVKITPTVREALQLAKEMTSHEGLICIAGSLYLVGEAQKILAETRP